MSVYYKLRTSRFEVFAEHVQTDPDELNNRTRGDTATFDLYTKDGKDLIVEGGTTYTVESGTTEVYDDVTVESNGTLDVDGTLLVNGELNVQENGTKDVTGTVNVSSGDGLSSVLEYDRHAGAYASNRTLNDTIRYKEKKPSNANIDSLVVGLEPATELENRDIAGKWGLVDDVTDSRTRPLTNPVVTVEVTILADLSEYSDVDDVQSTLAI